jgi:hypothetical protein
MSTKRSIRVIALSLENAQQRIATHRQSFLEQGQYEDYLTLVQFSQVLNTVLVELGTLLDSSTKIT